jgi:hypothetical protein
MRRNAGEVNAPLLEKDVTAWQFGGRGKRGDTKRRKKKGGGVGG